MQMLRIGHNNAGASPDWHLDKVSCSWLQTAAMKVQQICGMSVDHTFCKVVLAMADDYCQKENIK